MTYMGRLALVLIIGAVFLSAEAAPDYVRAQAKIEAIAEENVPPGSTVTLSPAEVNAYARGEAAAVAEDGLKDVDVQLRTGSLTASGTVNPSRLPSLEGSWVLGNLLNGDTPFSVDASVVSGRGTVTVNIERLTIAAQEFDSSATDFLLGWLLRPLLGTAKLGEPIPLEHNVERIQIRPTGVEIRIAD